MMVGSVLYSEPRDNTPDELICNPIDTPVALSGGINDTLVLEYCEMLANYGLGLLKTLPEIGYACILFLNHTKKFKSQRMTTDFEFLGISFNHFFRAASLFDHSTDFITI